MTINSSLVPAYKRLVEMQPYLDKALPVHMCSDRLIMLAYSELKKNAMLNKCTVESICGTIMSCAQLGLEPGISGMVYLVPYGTQATLMLGYKGMIELSHRSDKITSVEAACVYKNDTFSMKRGTSPGIEHEPSIEERGPMIGVYSVVTMRNGYKQFDFMNMGDINKIRNRSRSGGSGPWVTDMEQMAQKTVIRRLLKLVPSSISLNNAIALDEAAERGDQRMGDVVEGMLSEQDNIVDIQTQSDKLADKLAGMGE